MSRKKQAAAGYSRQRHRFLWRGVAVEASIKGLCARVVVTQQYWNAEASPIEAVYVFPLDEAAAVCGFEALIDNVHVIGEVKGRDEAFEEYDNALLEGHGAYLLDQERPDVFTASIGNIPPGKTVIIRITYVTELSCEGDDIRFILPTTVSPRYAPPESQVGVGRTPAEVLNPPVNWQVPYGFTVNVNLEMASAIRSVGSPSHPIAVELDGARGTVRLGERASTMDRDFVLLVALAESHAPLAWIEVDPTGTYVAALAFQPQFAVEQAPSELVFVLDRSGSMGGTSIAEAKNALQLCLRSLPEGSRFNVISFGSTFQSVFPESRQYTNESLVLASAAVAVMDADLGGTEILAPLNAVLMRPGHPEIPRQLFVLTDGEVTNTEAVLRLIHQHASTTRVFAFGIGAGASHYLVKGMARAGNGAAEFIYPGERIEPKVLRQLKRALVPALTDVRMDWGDRKVTQAPYHVPPLFAGSWVLVYGFFEDNRPGPVILRARGAQGQVEFSLALDPAAAMPDKLLATLAARTLIRDLEEGTSALHARQGSKQQRDQEDKVRAEIIRLGTTYQLCSRETSFIAIERRESPVEGELHLRKVPIALTRGWGGVEQGMLPGPSCSHVTPPKATMPPPANHAPRKGRPLDCLVALQQADGSWDLTEELAEILGRQLQELDKYLRNAIGDPSEARRAWATALALVYLEKQAAEWQDEWELLAEKAERWLTRCQAKLADGGSWIDAASRFFSKQ